MAKERTPEEGVPMTKRVSRMFGGRGKDIELPRNGGKRDPRLPASMEDVHNALHEAGEGLKAVRKLGKRNGSDRSKR